LLLLGRRLLPLVSLFSDITTKKKVNTTLSLHIRERKNNNNNKKKERKLSPLISHSFNNKEKDGL